MEIKIGDIKKGSEIGKNSKKNRYIWIACTKCGRLRWVQYFSGKPLDNICKHCARKTCGLHSRGKTTWKGGRHPSGRGYIEVRVYPEDFFYPMTKSDGYVFEHRLVMAKSLGRNLNKSEVVHHMGTKYPMGSPDDRVDNRLENLILLSSRSEHMALHEKLKRDLKEGQRATT
jgi:hypothetical protein